MIKDKRLLLTGYRNYLTGLWDAKLPIPVTNIPNATTTNNTHPGLYLSRKKINNIYSESSPKKCETRQKESSLWPSSFVPSHGLVDDNELQYHLHNQQKDDNNSYCPIQHFQDEELNVIIRKHTTKTTLENFLHEALIAPRTSTLIKAIHNHLTTFPGLDAQLIQKHLPPSENTALGHIKQERHGLQSTKLTNNHPTTEQENDFFPPSDTPNIKTNEVMYSLVNNNKEGLGYFDLTGKFPYRSARGNQYILIGYHYDSNAILAVPIKNRNASVITAGWKELHDQFTTAGVAPTTYILDNEVSATIKDAFKTAKVSFQLATAHQHRVNAAERAIQTFKDHFKTCLTIVDPTLPLNQWDRLIDQTILTLNLLRSSRMNPKLSAYAQLFGQFDYNKSPIAPPGTKIVAHVKPSVHGTWDLNGEKGWYIGPSLNHYRNVHCYFPKKRTTRHVDTVEFFPHSIPFPEVKLKDFLQQAAMDIVDLLTNPTQTYIPSLKTGDPFHNALLDIATALNRVEKIPKTILKQSTPFTATVPRVEKTNKQKEKQSTPSTASYPRVEQERTNKINNNNPEIIPPNEHTFFETTPPAQTTVDVSITPTQINNDSLPRVSPIKTSQ